MMRRTLIWALLLIAVCVLFCIFSEGTVAIQIFSFSQKMPTAIAILSFTGLGIVIGALLK